MKLKGISDKGLRRLAQTVEKEQRSYTSLKPGDRVYHYRFGKGEVTEVNTHSYSIPMAVVFYDDYGETIIRCADELKLQSDMDDEDMD